MEKVFQLNRFFWAWLYLSIIVGNLTFLMAGNFLYKEFVLQRKVVMIGEVDSSEENVLFEGKKKSRN